MSKNYLFALIDDKWHLCAVSNFVAPTEKNLEWLMQNAVGYVRHVTHKNVPSREEGEDFLPYYMRVMGYWHHKIVQAETQVQAMRELGIQEIYQI